MSHFRPVCPGTFPSPTNRQVQAEQWRWQIRLAVLQLELCLYNTNYNQDGLFTNHRNPEPDPRVRKSIFKQEETCGRTRLQLGDPPAFRQPGKGEEKCLGRLERTDTYIMHNGFVIVMTLSSFLTHFECLYSQSTIAIDFVLVLMQLEWARRLLLRLSRSRNHSSKMDASALGVALESNWHKPASCLHNPCMLILPW